MQIWQWLRSVEGWASRQVGFTVEENNSRSVMTAEKLYLVWDEGTGPALAVPRSLHAASQAVLMLNLQLTRFMDCLMKNLSGNLQENIEQWPNYAYFCKERRAPLAQRCPDDDWHQKLISGVLWSLSLFWIGIFCLMWHQSSPFA